MPRRWCNTSRSLLNSQTARADAWSPGPSRPDGTPGRTPRPLPSIVARKKSRATCDAHPQSDAPDRQMTRWPEPRHGSWMMPPLAVGGVRGEQASRAAIACRHIPLACSTGAPGERSVHAIRHAKLIQPSSIQSAKSEGFNASANFLRYSATSPYIESYTNINHLNCPGDARSPAALSRLFREKRLRYTGRPATARLYGDRPPPDEVIEPQSPPDDRKRAPPTRRPRRPWCSAPGNEQQARQRPPPPLAEPAEAEC
jgi:hypothetical protein